MYTLICMSKRYDSNLIKLTLRFIFQKILQYERLWCNLKHMFNFASEMKERFIDVCFINNRQRQRGKRKHSVQPSQTWTVPGLFASVPGLLWISSICISHFQQLCVSHIAAVTQYLIASVPAVRWEDRPVHSTFVALGWHAVMQVTLTSGLSLSSTIAGLYRCIQLLSLVIYMAASWSAICCFLHRPSALAKEYRWLGFHTLRWKTTEQK